MAGDSKTILRIVNDENLASEWELVLLSQGLSPEVRPTPHGVELSVPSAEADRALAALDAYENDHAGKLSGGDAVIETMNLPAGVLIGVSLVAFFAVTVWGNPTASWLERGSANAGRMLDGELWRAVTALTLHADVAHVVSNAFAIAVFFSAVAGQLGAGTGGMLVLFAGAGGNLVNALVQGSPHDAIGASTAVFATVGMLGSLALIRRRALGNKRRAWTAIAAALALLAMLGAGGGRTDVLAHLFGFIAGGVSGIWYALLVPRPAPPALQKAWAGAALVTIGYCWTLALG